MTNELFVMDVMVPLGNNEEASASDDSVEAESIEALASNGGLEPHASSNGYRYLTPAGTPASNGHSAEEAPEILFGSFHIEE